MATLDKRRLIKNYMSQYKNSTTKNPVSNNAIAFSGVSNRSSLSKAGYKPTTGWGYVYRIKKTPFGEMRVKIKGVRKSGACR